MSWRKKLPLNTPQRLQLTANSRELVAPVWEEITLSLSEGGAVVCIRLEKKKWQWKSLPAISHHSRFRNKIGSKIYGFIIWDRNMMIYLWVPSWLPVCHLLLCSLPFLFLCTDLLKLNSQSEWILSPNASVPDSTCWIGRKLPKTRADYCQRCGTDPRNQARRPSPTPRPPGGVSAPLKVNGGGNNMSTCWL